jgi:hypothetical protein
MANDLMIKDDGFADAAKEAESNAIRGSIIKFSKGLWSPALPEDSRLVATETREAWVRWDDGAPVEHIWQQPARRLPERDELSLPDEADWPIGLDGKPADPWQLTRYLYLVDPRTAEQFTFAPTSYGGRGAVTELAQQITTMRYARPGACPVVALGVGHFTLKKRPDLGKIPKPIFKVVGWAGGGDVNSGGNTIEPPARSPVAVAAAKVPAAPRQVPVINDMDDEIPF